MAALVSEHVVGVGDPANREAIVKMVITDTHPALLYSVVKVDEHVVGLGVSALPLSYRV
jgi:hypothetical protein